MKPAGVAGAAREAHRRCAVLCAGLSHYPDILTFSGAGRSVNRKTLELLRPVIATRASGFRRVAACPDGTLARVFGRRHRIAIGPDRDNAEPWELKVWRGEWSACQPNGASVSEDACQRVRSGSVVSAVSEGDGLRKERPQAVVLRRDESSKLVSHAPPLRRGCLPSSEAASLVGTPTRPVACVRPALGFTERRSAILLWPAPAPASVSDRNALTTPETPRMSRAGARVRT